MLSIKLNLLSKLISSISCFSLLLIISLLLLSTKTVNAACPEGWTCEDIQNEGNCDACGGRYFCTCECGVRCYPPGNCACRATLCQELTFTDPDDCQTYCDVNLGPYDDSCTCTVCGQPQTCTLDCPGIEYCIVPCAPTPWPTITPGPKPTDSAKPTIYPTPTIPVPTIPVERSCEVNEEEWPPLRPYPAEICGPVQKPDLPYCAMRPWAVKQITYLKNVNQCFYPDQPCIVEMVGGDYSIDLAEYEMPLVSVNRTGFETLLSFFNRAQEHLADYLEGRSYYEGRAEPNLFRCDPATDPYCDCDPHQDPYCTNSINDVWRRLGVFRKLVPISIINQKKSENILKAQSGPDQEVHDYIVGYEQDNAPADWGIGNKYRMTDFLNYQPPLYECADIIDPQEKSDCQEIFNWQTSLWSNSIYGKLWPNIPIFTREDTIGYVSFIPEDDKVKTGPNGTPIIYPFVNEVSMPHLNRLDKVSSFLQDFLASNLLNPYDPYNPYAIITPPPEEEFEDPLACPAGGWAICPMIAGIFGCPDCEIDCNQSAPAIDTCVFSKEIIKDLASRWVSGAEGNHVEECYNDVIFRSVNNGIDPALSMWLWLHESNASNYNFSVQDFGVNYAQYEGSFDLQIEQYMLRPNMYRTDPRWSHCFGEDAPINPLTAKPMTPYEAFLWIYRSGNCDPNHIGAQTFVNAFYDQRNWVSSCPIPNYPK